jgi:Ser/Thr protein kinase RdoA (MazF antagonist)
MKPYSALTVRGQARRLRSLALNALKKYELDVARLRLMTNDMNGIFRVDTFDGKRYVLRVTLPEGGHTYDHVTTEMDWLAALSRETHLSVPCPQPALDGTYWVEAAAAGVPQPRICVVFSWIPGKDLAENLSPTKSYLLGELMAKLHLHAQTYRPPQGLALLSFDRVFPFPEPVVLFDKDFRDLLPPSRQAVYQRALSWAQESINGLIASGEPMRILHSDLHQWNVRVCRDVLSPIDFEDLMLGWPVQDIATTFYYFPEGAFSALRDAFQDGYTRHADWPERCPGEIDSFIAVRGIGLVNFVLNDPNPQWKSRQAEFIERVEKRVIGLLEKNVK